MALIGHLEHLERAAALAHGLDGCCRQDVGICAAYHHHGYSRECIELLPQRRERMPWTDSLEDRREPWVVVGNEAPAGLFERCPREGEPVLVVPFRKLVGEPSSQGVGC